jgi:hypothetical protein
VATGLSCDACWHNVGRLQNADALLPEPQRVSSACQWAWQGLTHAQMLGEGGAAERYVCAITVGAAPCIASHERCFILQCWHNVVRCNSHNFIILQASAAYNKPCNASAAYIKPCNADTWAHRGHVLAPGAVTSLCSGLSCSKKAASSHPTACSNRFHRWFVVTEKLGNKDRPSTQIREHGHTSWLRLTDKLLHWCTSSSV